MKKWLTAAGGMLAGALNGLLGAGGGMIVVPLLKKSGLTAQKAHATSVSVIFPIALLSAVLYLTSGRVQLSDATPYLAWGVVGSVIGAWLLPKISSVWLNRIFGALMIWAAVRMFFR